MSDFMEYSAKTRNEAIMKAVMELGVTSDQLEIQVVSEGSSGFFGIGSKPAVIRVRRIHEDSTDLEIREIVENVSASSIKELNEEEKKKPNPKPAKKEKKPVSSVQKTAGGKQEKTEAEAPSEETDQEKKDVSQKNPAEKKKNEKKRAGKKESEDSVHTQSVPETDKAEESVKAVTEDEPKEMKTRPERPAKSRNNRNKRVKQHYPEKNEAQSDTPAAQESVHVEEEKPSRVSRPVKILTDPEQIALVEARAKKFIEDVFGCMDLGEVEINSRYNSEEGCLDVDFEGEDMGVLIGKRGQTLDSLQYLTSLVVNKDLEDYVRVKLDTEDYRRRRKETLENLARGIAYKVKKNRRPVVLEPMNPYERRIIHSALQGNKYVETMSEGEEPYRHVVVKLKKF